MAKAASEFQETARVVEVEVIPPDIDQDNPPPRVRVEPGADRPGAQVSKVIAYLLDDLIKVPGTRFRVGLDPLIGLVPGVGDITGGLAASLILITAVSQGVPRVIQLRMFLNVLLNAAVGAIPVAGDAFSFWFKSNARNHALLLKHMGRKSEVTRGDWIFVGTLLGLIALIVVLILFVLGSLLNTSARYWFS